MTGIPPVRGGEAPDGSDVPDGDLARLARDGDPVAFRLLVERHQPTVRARAARLCANPSDIDDIVQEAFLQAFTSLDRMRDPDRFGSWLAGVVVNVCRNLRRRERLTLVPDWPEPLHPTAPNGPPSAEDLDRAEALHASVAGLPAGQRRAIALHYYADLSPAQIAGQPGAARASLHKARLRLRDYITEHRPDLIPAASRRAQMTTVRIARVERRVPPGPLPDRYPTDLVMLADDRGQQELAIWLLARDGDRVAEGGASCAAAPEYAGATAARSVDELTSRLLRAAGATVTGVDIDELGPGVTVARIGLASAAGSRHVTARLGEGLAVAAKAGAPIRVSDTVMSHLAVPAGTSRPGPLPAPTAAVLQPGVRPRYQPRNTGFADGPDGLHGWLLDGSFTEHPSESHWHDYACTANDGIAALSATVPQPEGFACLAQEIFADDYLNATITFRGQLRTPGTTGRAGLFLRVSRTRNTGADRDIRGPMSETAILADPGHHIVTIASTDEWARHEVTACVPDDCDTVAFGIFLAGPGRIELRDAELSRTS